MSLPLPSGSFSSLTLTSTPTSTNAGSIGGGAPATATLLFGFLVIFAALFSAFIFLILFWKVQQRRRGPDVGEFRGAPGGVPKLWEVWIRDELPTGENQWNWESTSPLSIDVDRDLSSGQSMSPSSRSRRTWPYRLFRRRPAPPLPPPPPPSQTQQQQQQLDDVQGAGAGAGAEATATGLVSGLRASFVIAMPHADAPDRRRSEISQVSRSWGRSEYAIGIYHPSFREGWTL